MADHLTGQHLLLEHRKPVDQPGQGTKQALGDWSVIAGAPLDSATGSHQIAALLELGTQLAVRAAGHPDPRAFRLVHHQPEITGIDATPASETIIWWAGQAAAPTEIAKRLQGGGS